jgi:hypothetical protein
MSSTLRNGYTGHHHPTIAETYDNDKPMSSLKAVLSNFNAGHLMDARAPYRVNMYGLGISLADADGNGRYVRTFVFPITRTTGGTPAHLDCRVLVGTESGTAATKLRIAPFIPGVPPTDTNSMFVFTGATTVTEGAWVIDSSTFANPIRPMTPTVLPVVHGSGTLRGVGLLWLVRADVEVTVTGATSGNWFGVAAVQIREHVYTP